ncbi:MAG: HlyD family efflux transporter periplasmic adaptor subunit [Pseudomonadota bacterium]
MRFLTRSFLGLFLLTVTAGFLAMAVRVTYDSAQQAQARNGGGGGGRERVFTVEVTPITLGTATPEIATFGEVISGRTLELRAASGGEIVELSKNFREGGFVEEGDVLFQTDPANAQSRLAIADNELAEALADLADAEGALVLAKAEVAAAEAQLKLRQRSMQRQDDLRARGVGTDTAMESAELQVSSARQALLAKQLAEANAKARIARGETMVGRRQINRDEAARLLADTTVRADFNGVLSDVTAVLGRLVNANEKLGNLIDPDALEVSFRVASDEFRALGDGGRDLAAARVTVVAGGWDSLPATIDRVSAAVGEGRTGRELFAKLGQTSLLSVRPGDFVSVRVEEPPLENVARIPATSANSGGEVLLVGPDNRLEMAVVNILRRQGDDLIVRADGLAGRKLVLSRAPQLGQGIRVNPREPGGSVLEERQMVTLDPARRAALVAAVEAATRMPPEARQRILGALAREEIPAEMIARLEARIGAVAGESGGGSSAGQTGPSRAASTQPAGDTVALSDEDRARFIAFIEGNGRIPADRKTQILQALNQPQVPKAMVDRISQRIGG